jgi:hypothetical protein
MLRTLESTSGSGPVHSGERLLGSFSYRIDVYQKMIGPGNRTPGLKSVKGQVSGDSRVLFDLASSHAPATLTLEDGRRINFFLVDSSGSLAGAGGFY